MQDSEILYLWSPWLDTSNTPWEEILDLGRKRHYKKNSIILGQGQTVSELCYLHTGEIKLSSTSASGNEKPIWYIKAGNVFGEVPFFDHGIMNSYFICTEDCSVYFFSKEVLMETIFPKYPHIVMNIFETMAKKLRLMSSQINDLSLNPPKLRVYKMIYASLSHNETAHISQQELADLLGMHRITLNRIISDLKNDGIIQKNENEKRFSLCDPKGLLELIEAEQE
ncbi:Crp/Fnr family transcriptional regulator [Dehalobacterium formicoaceticum]|uniref:Crp/Fnr family transcriptional regulator n=1 Tax=Dehalobacterium formicoaceticum TaxID=51515 RepID=A0ABT1Y230_9FIRM|nr:Crp/Fnr family transcriptional regulator [Dehalobacterium formicoaceticum]MCR6544924.1 Crp/Fnr family transcriptional regulator [Dehalobacterium formicoaceticum]